MLRGGGGYFLFKKIKDGREKRIGLIYLHMKLKRGRRGSKSIQTLPTTTLLSATNAADMVMLERG